MGGGGHRRAYAHHGSHPKPTYSVLSAQQARVIVNNNTLLSRPPPPATCSALLLQKKTDSLVLVVAVAVAVLSSLVTLPRPPVRPAVFPVHLFLS